MAGSGRRYQVNAVHTSKACNVISKYTAFVPVDLSTYAYLPTVVEYTHTGNKARAEGGASSWEGGCHLRNLAQRNPMSLWLNSAPDRYSQGRGAA